MKQTKNSSSVSLATIIQDTINTLQEIPIILFLFLFIAVLDFIALCGLFLSHSEPFSTVFAPIIRAFWGSRFLHYPDNFLLLPKLFNYSHLVILSTFGLVISGIIIKRIEFALQGKSDSTLSTVRPVIKSFVALLFVWAITYALYTILLKKLFPIMPPQPIIQLALGYIISVLIQSLTVYLIPAIVVSRETFLKKLREGFTFAIVHFGTTIALVAIPSFFITLLSAVKILVPYFVSFNPELVLLVLSVGIFVSMAVDLLITTSTALLFLKVRNLK